MRLGLALLSGLLLGLSFPKWGMGYLAFIALVPLLSALHSPGTPRRTTVPLREAFRLGALTGFVFFVILLYWIPQLPQENVTIPFAMYPILLLMAGWLCLFTGAAALGSAWLARRGVPLGFAFPLAWTLMEVARGSGVIGFPWGSLGYAMADTPHLIQFASLTGLWGVSLWVALVNGLIHAYLDLPWVTPKVSTILVLVMLFSGPYLHGRMELDHRPPRPGARVGLIQPNTDKDKWTSDMRGDVLQNLMEHTRRLLRAEAERPPRLVIWPETAVPSILPQEREQMAWIQAMVDSLDISLLAGYPDATRGTDGEWVMTNSAGLIVPDLGLIAQYDKRHLVPFSEYMPLPILDLFDFGQSSFTPGTKSGVINTYDPPFGVLICFESVFPGGARELARTGARFLVNITNDQWFGDSAAPVQHLRMNVLRVIENRMGMARAANTGISAILDPYGYIHEYTATFEPMRMAATVELGRGTTFYTRHGDWIVWVTAGLLGGLFLLAWRRPR